MELTREIRAKRVAIARDMLAQLMREDMPLRILAGNTYVCGDLDFAITSTEEMQSHVDAIQATCNVCQLGGLLLSKARLYDGVPGSVFYSSLVDDEAEDEIFELIAERDELMKAMSDIFDSDTLQRLEAAFEETRWRDDKAARYGKRYPDARARAIAITQNLVDNDGEFLVPALEAV